VSHAVITPTFYLENLLMPYVLDAVRERGVLPYPIRADFPASWASHLDIADAVVALFDRTDITGMVSVGQYPAITGPDLAEAFGAHFGKDVLFEQITPEQFRSSVAPLIGEGPAADVAGAYAAMSTLPGRSITPENSAQKLLGITPRTTGQADRHMPLTATTVGSGRVRQGLASRRIRWAACQALKYRRPPPPGPAPASTR
jgi:hypothetical protein